MAIIKKARKNGTLKQCPFANKKCGGWCQLFMGKECIFQSIDWFISQIANKQANKKITASTIRLRSDPEIFGQLIDRIEIFFHILAPCLPFTLQIECLLTHPGCPDPRMVQGPILFLQFFEKGSNFLVKMLYLFSYLFSRNESPQKPGFSSTTFRAEFLPRSSWRVGTATITVKAY